MVLTNLTSFVSLAIYYVISIQCAQLNLNKLSRAIFVTMCRVYTTRNTVVTIDLFVVPMNNVNLY